MHNFHDFLVDAISVVIALGILVMVHELGHFIAAKLCGVRVEQFSIGFPPRLIGFRIGETDYCLSATPLGGYVKMTGESMPGENLSLKGPDGETLAAQAADPGALTSHPRWQRIIIGAAGPFSNFVLALGLMTGFYMLHNEVPLYEDQPIQLDWVTPGSAAANAGLMAGDTIVSFDGQASPTWEQVYEHSELNLQSENISHNVPLTVQRGAERISMKLSLSDGAAGTSAAAKAKAAETFTLDALGFLPVIQPGPVTVVSVTANSPAFRAGLQSGDRIVSIDGHAFHGTPTIIEYMQSRKGAPLNVAINHGGTSVTQVIQPTWDTGNGPPAWRIGFNGGPPPFRVEQMPLPKALKASVKFNREKSVLIVEVLKRLLSNKMSVSTLSGPIGIAQQTGMAAQSKGWEAKFEVLAALSLNLGILNLLPFPILDGGMILFLLIESVIRRDVNVAVKERVYQVAFVLIVLFFAYIMFNDISKLSLFNHAKP